MHFDLHTQLLRSRGPQRLLLWYLSPPQVFHKEGKSLLPLKFGTDSWNSIERKLTHCFSVISISRWIAPHILSHNPPSSHSFQLCIYQSIHLFRKVFPKGLSLRKGLLGSTMRAFPGMSPSTSPCMIAVKQSVVGSGPMRLPGTSCSSKYLCVDRSKTGLSCRAFNNCSFFCHAVFTTRINKNN